MSAFFDGVLFALGVVSTVVVLGAVLAVVVAQIKRVYF